MTESQDQASAAALSAMKLPQLQAIANQLGLKGISRLRKGELIEAIRQHGAQDGEKGRREQPPARQKAASRQKPEADQKAGAAPEKAGAAQKADTGQKRGEDRSARERSGRQPRQGQAAGQHGGAQQGKEQRAQRSESKAPTLDVFAEFSEEKSAQGAKVASLEDIQLPPAEDDEQPDPGGRRRRGRDRRDRKRRPNNREGQGFEEVEVADGDVLVPIAGILDVLDNYAFVRTTGYLPGSSDVYVNLGMVRRFGLRRGDAITGAVRQPREGESSGRQKFNALVTPETVNNAPAEEGDARPDFETFTPVYPEEFLALGDQSPAQKIVDTVAPLALGQRVLVTAGVQVPRMKFLTEVAQGVFDNHAGVHLMMVLLDERPEDATHLQRNVQGEVIASSFDRSGSDHITVANLAVERAKRLAELGQDVVVILDSLTALTRAYHTSTSPSQRVLDHGVDASTVHSVKRLFGAARKIENGGSLTLIATALTETGAAMDELIIDELSPVASTRISLASEAGAAVVVPSQSQTRNLEAIFDVDALAPRIVLARLLAERGPKEGAAWLQEQLKDTTSAQFLANSVKVTPLEKAAIRRAIA